LERALHRDPALDVDGNTELGNASEREDEEPSADRNISSGVTVQNEQETFFSLRKNGVNEYVRTADGRFVLREGGEKLRVLNDDHQGATPEKNITGKTATPEEARVDSGEAEEEPGWVLSSGDLQKEQKTFPQPEKDPRSQWDSRIGKNGVIEHFRSSDGRVAVRETGDKIQIIDQDHDSLALALDRAFERFGTHLHFDGNQAGARTLVDIVVTHDLRVTFTDDRLNAQIDLLRVHHELDRGRPIATSEREQTVTQKAGAGDASGSTPERKTAVQPDGKLASQQTGEVFVDCGAAPFDFDKKNDLNYFLRTSTPQGEQRIYWGKDLPRALEEAGAKVGDSITATRVASKPVTVEEIQEQPDGTKQVVRADAKRNSWQVDNHGVNREALIKAYDVLVKTPEDRKKLERTAPLLVATRDQAVVELKREKLAAELNQRNLKNHTVRSMKI
jgi:Large polyvalent protein-associated domain 7